MNYTGNVVTNVLISFLAIAKDLLFLKGYFLERGPFLSIPQAELPHPLKYLARVVLGNLCKKGEKCYYLRSFY